MSSAPGGHSTLHTGRCVDGVLLFVVVVVAFVGVFVFGFCWSRGEGDVRRRRRYICWCVRFLDSVGPLKSGRKDRGV